MKKTQQINLPELTALELQELRNIIAHKIMRWKLGDPTGERKNRYYENTTKSPDKYFPKALLSPDPGLRLNVWEPDKANGQTELIIDKMKELGFAYRIDGYKYYDCAAFWTPSDYLIMEEGRSVNRRIAIMIAAKKAFEKYEIIKGNQNHE